MKFRGLLVAVLALAVLGGLVWWSQRREKDAAGKADPNASPKILNLAANDIRRIEIHKSLNPRLVLEKSDAGVWSITAPEALEADADAVSSLVSTLATLNADRVVEEKLEEAAPFGLAAPPLEVTVTLKDGKSHRLQFGDDTPTGGGTYVRAEGDPRLFTIASWNKSSIDKTAADLREKRLLRFQPDQVSRVELSAKGESLEFGKVGEGAWQILKPKPLRADGGAVGELVRVLADARMDSSALGETPAATGKIFAAASRVAVARVTDAAGTQEMEVRKTKDNNYYARSSRVAGAFRVMASVGEGLDKGLGDFRNRKLFDFGWKEPVEVEIRDGDRQAAFVKKEDKWLQGDKRVAPETVQAVIDKLRDLSATAFPESGFSTAAIEARIRLEDSKSSERVLVAQSGAKWIAKREGEPSLYEVDAAAIEELREAVGAVKEYQPPKDDKKK